MVGLFRRKAEIPNNHSRLIDRVIEMGGNCGEVDAAKRLKRETEHRGFRHLEGPR
jgi:hypothetical protein